MQAINIKQRQSGAILITSLIILMVLTMIAMTSTRSSELELIMSTNSEHAMRAFMRAEEAVFGGEQEVATDYIGAPTINFATEGDGYYIDDQLDMNNVEWGDIDFVEVGDGDAARRYILEYMGPTPMPGSSQVQGAGFTGNLRYLYRVSGQGVSARGSARVVQTIYAVTD